MVTDYWEKCGTSKGDQSYTIKGVPCQSSCEMKKKTLTEDYWWCKDNDQDPSSWDYCSPPGQVLTLMNKFKLKKRETGAACPIHKAWACLSGAVRAAWRELLVVLKVPQVASSFPKSTPLSRWAGTDSQAEDEWWEYCSPSKHRTRFSNCMIAFLDHNF